MSSEGKISDSGDGRRDDGGDAGGKVSEGNGAAEGTGVGGPNLVQRFVDYAFRMIHTKMDDFFTENMKEFDQDWDNYLQQGETLEQYELFKRYENLLDENLTEFAVQEGYDDAGE